MGHNLGRPESGTVLTQDEASDVPRVRAFDFEGSTVRYEDVGAGQPVLVLIHGWTCDRTFWRMQVDALAPGRRLLVIDLPGHGESGAPERAYSIPYFARSVRAMVADAGVQRAVFIGHSLGFPIAREVSRQDPRGVIALVGVDGSLIRPPDSQREEDTKAWRERITEFVEKVTGGPDPAVSREEFVRSMFGPGLSDAWRQEIVRRMGRTPQQVARSALMGIADVHLWRIDSVSLPTLSVVAHREGSGPEREALWRQCFPSLEYREFCDVGHFLMIEQKDEFNEALVGFLGRLRDASSEPPAGFPGGR